jgi:hypothetical protein
MERKASRRQESPRESARKVSLDGDPKRVSEESFLGLSFLFYSSLEPLDGS